MARPSIFTEELANSILLRIAEGESLSAICSEEGMPTRSTVSLWIVDGKHKEFSDGYARARQAQAVLMAEELMGIADDGSNDWMTKNGSNGEAYESFNSEHYQRSRLRVDTRKWYLSKVLPKVYGDKQTVDHTSTDGTMTPKGTVIAKDVQDILDNL